MRNRREEKTTLDWTFKQALSNAITIAVIASEKNWWAHWVIWRQAATAREHSKRLKLMDYLWPFHTHNCLAIETCRRLNVWWTFFACSLGIDFMSNFMLKIAKTLNPRATRVSIIVVVLFILLNFHGIINSFKNCYCCLITMKVVLIRKCISRQLKWLETHAGVYKHFC